MVTTRTKRTEVTTSWDGRKWPFGYAAPLQDAYRKVRDQDNEIIYILSNTWKLVPLTKWWKRTEETTTRNSRPAI